MDLGRQAAARAAQGVVDRLNEEPVDPFRVVRQIPCDGQWSPGQGGGVLMGSVDRGADAQVPLDLAAGISQRDQVGVDPIPAGPVRAEPFVALPHRLPGTELRRQIASGDPGAEPVDDPFEDLPVISERPMTTMPDRHQGLDLSPVGITEDCEA